MEEKQRISLITALMNAYVLMSDKSARAAYGVSIEPLLGGISSEDRLKLAAEFRGREVYGPEVHSFDGLADYLDPPVGGS